MQIVFLVLHYKTFEVTRRCVDSILKYSGCQIVIMDNGSNNSSGERLQCYYKENQNVHVIIGTESRGFSSGNNYAYSKMKELGIIPDFLIACNNDLVFEQDDFIQHLVESYYKSKAAVIGPDIRVYKNPNIHQNPLMLRARTSEEIRKYKTEVEQKLENINLVVAKQRIKKALAFIVRRKERQVNLSEFDFSQECLNVCLCGACLIFTPSFFEKYKKSLFEPETHFYHEEEILFYRLKKNKDFMMYVPQIYVLHDHSISTSEKFNREKERLEFQYKNNLNSCDILLDFIEECDIDTWDKK